MTIDKRINYRSAGFISGRTKSSKSKSSQSKSPGHPGNQGGKSSTNKVTAKHSPHGGGPGTGYVPPPKKKTTTWTPGGKSPFTHTTPPTKKTTGITGIDKIRKWIASNKDVIHGKSIGDLKNYGSIIGTYFGGMLPGKLGDWTTGIMRTDEMDKNLANLIKEKMTTNPTFDDKSGNISYADYGLPQSHQLKPTYDTEGRIEKWTKEPTTAFKAPSLKEMFSMDSAGLANALTLGNVGYSKDINTGKMSYTGTEYDDLGSKLFDTRPAKIPLNLNLANGGIADLYRYGGFSG